MNIQHEIISFYPPTGSMVVRYFCDEVPDGLRYNIDIPLENGAFIPQDKINELIDAMKPVGQLERLAALAAVEVPPELAALIPPPPPEPVVVDEA
jgi:hypothetical protein